MGKKPTPPTQKELSNSLIQTYNPPESHAGFLPNPNDNIISNSARSSQLTFKNDPHKPINIGIKDIDEAVYFYFEKVVQPSVMQNGTRIPVPIMYGAPERWVAAQKQGYLRDKQGKIMAPLIMFKRDSITKDRSMSNKVDANFPFNYQVVTTKYSPRNSYDRFDVLNNRSPQKEYQIVVVPDYVKVKYTCVIYTYYVEQMNKLVEAINYASDSYWGDPQRFKFNARIDSFGNTVELADGKDRTVKTTFDINLNGYLIPDDVNKSINSINKGFGVSTIIINESIVTKI